MVDSTRYKKRPVEIEARQLRGTSTEMFAVYQWVEGHIGSVPPPCDDPMDDPDFAAPVGVTIDPDDGCLMIRTLEGNMKASPGDWIIRGVAGEFYPCKPDIFAATYELSTGANTTLRTKPKLAVDPGTGVHWLSLRTGPRGYVARSIQMTGPGADENRCVVEDEANKINGIWILDYDGDGNLCGVEVV